MIGWLALAAVAAPPLQLPADADGAWENAAQLAGFRLGPCTAGPCARVVAGGIDVLLADGSSHRVTAEAREVALALARSRLALGAGRASAADHTPDVPARRPPHAATAVRIVVAPAPRVQPHAVVPVAPRTDFGLSLPRDPAPSRPATTWWASAWAGASSGALLGAQVGVQRGPWWAGAGGRMDGSFTTDLGAGVAARTGPLQLRAGAWLGAEFWPVDCFMCTIDVIDEGDVAQVTTTSPFWVPHDVSGLGPVARAELEVGIRLARRWFLAPRTGVAISQAGSRPEIAVTVIRTGG